METNNVEDKALQDNIILRRILTPPLPAALQLVYLPGQPLFIAWGLKNFTLQK
jgi:hypothetical protein